MPLLLLLLRHVDHMRLAQQVTPGRVQARRCLLVPPAATGDRYLQQVART